MHSAIMPKGVRSVQEELNGDVEIEAEIQRELDALKEDELDEEDGLNGRPTTFNAPPDEDSTKNVDIYPSEINDYLKLIAYDEDKTNKNILETEHLLVKTERDLNGINELFEEKLRQELGSIGESVKEGNLLQFRSEVLAEIEELEIEEEKEFAAASPQEVNLAVDIIRPDIIEEIKQFEMEERAKLKQLREKQKEEEQFQSELARKRQESQIVLEEQAMQRSTQRLEAVEKSMDRFQEKEVRFSVESEEDRLSFKEIEDKFQKKLKKMDLLREKEAKIYQEMKENIENESQKKRNNAALVIQKRFRGFRVRAMYQSKLEKLKCDRLKRKVELLDEIEKQEKLQKEAEEIKRKEAEKEKIEAQERERLEKQRIEDERLARLEKDKMEKERKEKDRVERERLEKERVEKERQEKQRLEKESEERERLEKDKLEKERMEKEKLEKERVEKESLERERVERERLEKERVEKERQEKQRLEQQRVENERSEKARLEKERLEKQKLEKERIERERLEKDRLEKERLEKERLEKDKLEKERLEKDRLEKERLEKVEKERVEKERLGQHQSEKGGLKTQTMNSQNEPVNSQRSDSLKDVQKQKSSLLPERIEKKRQEWMNAHIRYSECTKDSRTQPVARTRPRTSYRKHGSSTTLPDLSTDEILNCAPDGVSLQTVECIAVSNLDGIGLNALRSCPNLKFASLENCGIQILEGIDGCEKLEKFNLCRNKIDSLRISFNTCLREVLLSENDLSSVNGLDCLVNLEVLDLSANRITRIGSLSSCKKLQDLNLSGNQLISLKGLESLQTLMTLKAAKNHLANAKEVTNLPLLAFLDLRGNTMQLVPSLKNHVMLRKLYLDENNLTSLEELSDCWLPSLEILSVSGNSIEELPSLEHLLLLDSIDLRDNLIKENEQLISGIENCKLLSRLYISGNPVEGIPDIRAQIQSRLSYLSFLDDFKLGESQTSDKQSRSDFEAVCAKQRLEQNDFLEKFDKDLRGLEAVLSLYDRELKKLTIETQYRNRRFNLMVKHLDQHERFGREDTLDERASVIPKEEVPSLQAPKTSKQIQNGVESKINSKDDDAVKLKKNLKEQNSSDQVKESRQIEPQSTEDQERSEKFNKNKEKAATKIQALFRGYRLRCALYAALTSARRQGDGNDDDDFDYDEEVDLSAFDFDDDNQDWKPESSSQLPMTTALQEGKHNNDEDIRDVPKYAWQSQPRTPDPQIHHVERLDLEFSPEESEASMTIPESEASRKQEEIVMEWGFQNSSTADLMIKRARKMNAAIRKKNMMAPEKRYALFKKIQQTNPSLTVRPPVKKKTTQRMDYFAAQREASSPMSLSSLSPDRGFKQDMTYSWVCNQTVLHTDAHHDIINDQAQDIQAKPKKKQQNSSFRSKDNVSLPYMDPAIIAGKSVPLVILSSRHPNSPTSESSKERRCSYDQQESRAPSAEKSRSAPDPSKRSPHVMSSQTTSSSRSLSSETGRGKQRQTSYKR